MAAGHTCRGQKSRGYRDERPAYAVALILVVREENWVESLIMSSVFGRAGISAQTTARWQDVERRANATTEPNPIGFEKSARYTWLHQIAKSSLSPTTRLVAHSLALFGNADGSNIYPGVRAIAAASGLSQRAVCEHLDKLVLAGYVVRHTTQLSGPRMHTRLIYLLSLPKAVAEAGPVSARPWDADPNYTRRKRGLVAPATPKETGHTADAASAVEVEAGSGVASVETLRAYPDATCADSGARRAYPHEPQALIEGKHSLSLESINEVIEHSVVPTRESVALTQGVSCAIDRSTGTTEHAALSGKVSVNAPPRNLDVGRAAFREYGETEAERFAKARRAANDFDIRDPARLAAMFKLTESRALEAVIAAGDFERGL